MGANCFRRLVSCARHLTRILVCNELEMFPGVLAFRAKMKYGSDAVFGVILFVRSLPALGKERKGKGREGSEWSVKENLSVFTDSTTRFGRHFCVSHFWCFYLPLSVFLPRLTGATSHLTVLTSCLFFCRSTFSSSLFQLGLSCLKHLPALSCITSRK